MTKKEVKQIMIEETNESLEVKEEKKQITVEDLPGVGVATAEKLRDAGYNDLLSIAVASPAQIVETAGVGESAARKIINAARDNAGMDFESGEDLLKRAARTERIKTGSEELDKLIGGGIETGTITEAHGMYASGKCVGKNTNIIFFNPDKLHLKTIEEIYKNYSIDETPYNNGFIANLKRPIQVVGIDKNGKEKFANVSKLFKEHTKTLIKVETERGAILDLTETHPLLSLNKNGISWTSTGLLKEGDFIGTPRRIKTIKEENIITKEDAYFIGLFVAEGTGNPLSITNHNKDIVNWLMNYVEKKFNYKPTISRKGTIVLFRNPTKEFLGKLSGTNSGSKYIPEKVMNANKEIIESFLCGYIDGDGYVGNVIEMVTKSERLSCDLSYLLAKIDIKTSIKKKIIDGSVYYRVYITDPIAMDYIKNILKKSINKDGSLINTNRKIDYSNVYGIPLICVHLAMKRIYTKVSRIRRKSNKWNKKRMMSSKLSYLFDNYLASNPRNKRIGNKTLSLFLEFCIKRLKEIDYIKNKLNASAVTKEDIHSAWGILPFMSKDIAKRLNIKISTLQNYVSRNLPDNKITFIKDALIKEINSLFGDRELKKDIELLKTLSFGNISWEKIEHINKIDYNDFVYDLTVPDIHNFIGGNKPIFMHNSQIGYQAAVNVQLPKEQGGLGAGVVFLDTESTFRVERIKQIAESAGLDYNEVLKNIKVVRCFNSDHQMLLAEKINDLITKEKFPVRLIVVDSLISMFRSEYTGRGQLSERQQKLNRHIHTLQKLADMYNLAVYVTNQVMAKPDTFFGDPTQAVGGNIMAHGCNIRLYLRKGKKGTRVAKLVDSSSLPEGEAAFMITEHGIKDIK